MKVEDEEHLATHVQSPSEARGLLLFGLDGLILGLYSCLMANILGFKLNFRLKILFLMGEEEV